MAASFFVIFEALLEKRGIPHIEVIDLDERYRGGAPSVW